MANKSIFVNNQSGLLRNMPPVDLMGQLKILFDEYEKAQVAKFQETFVDKHFTYNPVQMSLNADALMGQYHFRVMASVIGDVAGTPLRATHGFQEWTHSIPRLGHKYPMKASEMRKLFAAMENPRISQASKVAELEKAFLNNVEDAYMGVKDTLDYMVLRALSDSGVVQFTPTLNNPQGIIYKIDYKMPSANIKQASKLWNKTNGDAQTINVLMELQDVVNYMSDKGISCSEILMSPEMYTFILRDLGVRKAIFGNDRSTQMVTGPMLQQMLDSLGIPPITVIKRKVAIERDGYSGTETSDDSTNTLLTPFNGNNIVFLPTGTLGEVQPSVEDSDLIPEENVTYAASNDGICVSKWAVGDSTGQQAAEFTQAAGRLLPIINQIGGVVNYQVKGFVEA